MTILSLFGSEPVVAGGVYDCLSAAIVQDAGYPVLALSGAGISASVAGAPDLGLLSFGELLAVARSVIAQSTVPVIVDADTGFGNELNVMRTCSLISEAGAGAIMIEDQVAPKRCGHLDGKEIVETSEFLSKIRAARSAMNADTALIARTDAIAVEGIDSAIDRANAALDAGADVAFVEAPTTNAQVEMIAERVSGPKMYSLATGGRSPALTFSELGRFGFDLIVIPGLTLMPAIREMKTAAAAVLTAGSDDPLLHYDMPPREIFETVGLSMWLERESDVARHRAGVDVARSAG